MKKVLLSFAVMAIASTAMGQALNPAMGQGMNPLIELPTVNPAQVKTVKEEGLKGNVLAVKYGKYVYKENFGEAEAGAPWNYWASYFDENGRVIIQRTIGYGNEMSDYSEETISSYVFDYTTEGDGMDVVALGIEAYTSGIPFIDLLTTEGYEDKIMADRGIKRKPGATNKHEMKFTKNGILTLYNFYSLRGTLEEKLIGKQNADKTWKFTKYKSSGEACEENTRSFNANGQLTKLEYSQYGPNHYQYNGTIKTAPAGIYKYDAKGRLISFQNPKEPFNMTYTVVYNDKGDMTNVVASWEKSGRPGTPKKKEKDESKEYSDYVYDSHGNWISRVVWNHQQKPRFIEKREFIYCASKEELKEKAAKVYQSAGGKIKAQQK